ncbi:MAG: glycosyltransferase family 2 protein [Candidatus Omnitrophica bacterium]|nr:glycosyltransferase family 2 protein [Candidatus Omnitrophota bacterium]
MKRRKKERQSPLKKNLVSAIVLNWNGKDVTSRCVDSLLKQTYQSLEIIVVDNGSEDGSLAMIRKKYGENIRVIENGKNLGFAGGCNVGILASRGEYVALINSDATVEKNWLEEMVKGIQLDENYGMAAGKIYFSNDKGLIENTGHVVYRDGLGRGRGRLERDQGQYDYDSTTFCPNGCAALYRRKLMDEIGMFDASFFAYADDIDVGFRGRLLGYECVYIPTAIAYHKLSASFGMLSPFKIFLLERNRLWVTIKCFPLGHLLMVPFYTILRYGVHIYGVLNHMGPASRYASKISFGSLLWIACKVYLSTLLHLPHLLMERFKIRRKTKTSVRDFEFWMKRYGLTVEEVALHEISY